MNDNTLENRLHAWIAALPSTTPWEARSETERTILLIYTLELEVSNGGIEQYLINPSGNKWKETLVALERIGAIRIKQIVESALLVFPNGNPSTDQMVRFGQLRNTGQEAAVKLSQLDDEYFQLYRQFPSEDSYVKMAQFLQSELD